MQQSNVEHDRIELLREGYLVRHVIVFYVAQLLSR